MPKPLPVNPSITQLKKQARELQRAIRNGDAQAAARVAASHPSPPPTFDRITLRDAQLVIAREYGFAGWHELNTAVGEQMVDQRDLHRWFGAQLNNGAWDTIQKHAVSASSTLAEREALVYSAYASAFHWRRVGTAANAARGEHLIARACTTADMPERALHHARRCLELVEETPEAMEHWDRAFALEALARAEAANGLGTAQVTLELAYAACAEVADPDDRAVVEQELARGPWFGLERRPS